MNSKIPFLNSKQEKNSYENLYLNPLEKELRRNPQPVDYTLKLIDVYPIYCLKEQKYICYRKEPKEEQKLLIIQEHINFSTYEWKKNIYYNTISLYHFINIRKNAEWIASWALSKGIEDSYLGWETWGVLEDGTILSPKETRKIIKLLQNNAIDLNSNGGDNIEGLDDYEARKFYIDSLAEGDSDV